MLLSIGVVAFLFMILFVVQKPCIMHTIYRQSAWSDLTVKVYSREGDASVIIRRDSDEVPMRFR